MPHQSLITFWYGSVQRFGHLGEPQRWVNVLGNIAAPVRTATYAINGEAAMPLSLGCDLHRLAAPGDFNVELPWDALCGGESSLTVTAVPEPGDPVSAQVSLRVTRGKAWPLPYRVDFASVGHLQDVVQVVDGDWQLVEDGVRTTTPYYDRVLSLGDASWTDYEARVRLTVHGFTPSAPGPPTYEVTHMGLALRWQGHHRDGLQPSRRWYPLGAQGEFLLRDRHDDCQWRILFDNVAEKPAACAGGRNSVTLGAPMQLRAQVQTRADGRTQYRYKQWLEEDAEPHAWDVEGLEEDDLAGGALCLVPHNADVTIHEVDAQPLPPAGIPNMAFRGADCG